jgi:adenylate kinase family enzyme
MIEADDKVLSERMKARRRADDTPENIERRIREYREIGTFTEQWYGSANTVRVDGTGRVQAVAARISQQIDTLRSKKGFAVRPPEEGGFKKRIPETSPAP